MCTTLGGVTGIANFTVRLVHTAAFSAGVAAAGAVPHPMANNPTTNKLDNLRTITTLPPS